MRLLDHGETKFPRAGVVASSRGRGWTGVACELRTHPAGDLPPFRAEHLEITIALQGVKDAVVDRKGDGVRQATRVDPGTIWISPVGVGEDDIRITRPLTDVLHVYLAADRFEVLSQAVDGPAVAATSVRYLAGVHDALLRQMGLALHAEMTCPTAAGKLLADAMALGMAGRLVQAHSDGGRRGLEPARVRGGLGEVRARRVLDYMAEHLADDLGIDELAAVANLSPFHFTRMFGVSFGAPPHRYLGQLRMQRARRLLSCTGERLVDVALACGFSSQSNFSRAFRQATGMTPAGYRNASS